MSFEQVVITLTPVYSPDSLPFRSLTFASNDDTVPIGRASNSQVKNLQPGHDNGWFNSRVMSRRHAVLSVRMEKKTVYVRDHGSLHGTQLNDVKISSRENIIVRTGDVLTFGSEISRGAETFRPVAVRIDCQWHESKRDTAPKQATNTFCVPDDEDDDVIEVVDSRDVHAQPKSPQNASDSSEADYGSDMSRPLDLTSPVTSPEIKASELPKQHPSDLEEVGNATHEPVVETRDSALPAFISSEPVHDDGDSQFDSEDASNSDSEISVPDKASDIYDDESDSDESEDGHDESNDFPEQEPSAAAPRFHINEPVKFRDESRSPMPVPGILMSETTTSSSQPQLATNVRGTTVTLSEEAYPPATSTNIPWPEYLIPRIPSPSDKAMAKSVVSPAPNYQSFNDYSSDFEMWSNNQGPSYSPYPDPAVNGSNPYGSITANETFPFGPHRSSGYLRHLAGDLLDEQPSASNEKPLDNPIQAQLNESSAATKEAVELAAAPNTRPLSIVDIVEKTAAAASSELKRKADDFEADFESTSKEISDTQDSITDAQPRPDMPNVESSHYSMVEIDSIHEAESSGTQEHRRKRIKTKNVHTFMKYATIAAVGAVVGSIGTIAGLASLPTDFFN